MTAPRRRGTRRVVSCGNHAFGEGLVCRCGVSWWAHQAAPKPCPLDARGRNRQKADDPKPAPAS
ncbi:MAG: hypothetical protein QNK03_14800 [Myxococcota bacterium]|nr:hypothetical protein [Myxococcota bacterium]